MAALAVALLACSPAGGSSGEPDDSERPAPAERIHHVSASGSDRNPGTQDRPWRTIQKAVDRLRPGGQVLVRAGTYRAAVTIRRSGTADSPIILRARPGARPRMLGKLTIRGSHVVVSGFVFVGTAPRPTRTRNEQLIWVSGGDHVTIAGNEITRSGAGGIYLGDEGGNGSDHAVIVRNWIHDNGTHEHFDHGIYYGHGTGGLIANNVIEHNLAFGVQLYPQCRDALVTQNTIVGNGRSGIIVGGDEVTVAENNMIVNNIVAFNAGSGITTTWAGRVGSGNQARNNLGYGNHEGDFDVAYGGIVFGENLVAHPLFTDRGKRDYRLRSFSPALGRALRTFTQAVDYRGRGRRDPADLGALERP